jgi:hypothetical protein
MVKEPLNKNKVELICVFPLGLSAGKGNYLRQAICDSQEEFPETERRSTLNEGIESAPNVEAICQWKRQLPVFTI